MQAVVEVALIQAQQPVLVELVVAVLVVQVVQERQEQLIQVAVAVA
jgi:hypothetical protein